MARDRTINWYCCGPTVYSHSHLGHARCYIVFDTIRRLLQEHFGFRVRYVMNVTDVDDKIIKASLETGRPAKQLAADWERDFFDKMGRLDVQLPDEIARVSEYVPEIVEYIRQILANGYAYEADGSVYFDVLRFKADGYAYCQLVPSRTDGDLTEETEPCEFKKKNRVDFVLWKKAKTGEPCWESPWGPGRPGWHIECSAMIEAAFGSGRELTVHSGGSDLKFPHHDNEIAQAEAFHCRHGWARYFFHCAPLTITGLKMSKSLKNFITIGDALERLTGRQIRLMFLLRRHTSAMNLDPDRSFQHAREKDRQLAAFLAAARANSAVHNRASLRKSEADSAVEHRLAQLVAAFDAHLANNFDTQSALEKVFEFVASSGVDSQHAGLNPCVVALVNSKLLHLLRVMGLNYQPSAAVGDETKTEDLVEMTVEYRREVLAAAKKNDTHAIFAASDKLRDVDLKRVGVVVEDGKPGWRYSRPTGEPSEESTPGTSAPREQMNFGIFSHPKYAKFDIGSLGEDGIPAKDTRDRPFPPKVRERFLRDLERAQTRSPRAEAAADLKDIN